MKFNRKMADKNKNENQTLGNWLRHFPTLIDDDQQPIGENALL